MERDMTEGSPAKLIFGFSFPLVFGLLFQQMYNIVDAAIVGKTLGVEELSAVGLTGSVSFLIIGFCVGTSTGLAIPIAQSFGADNKKEMRRYYGNGLWLSGIFSVLTTVVTLMLCGQILQWINTPEELYEYAYQYIFVILCGIPVTYFYNYFVGVMRALGDSKAPVCFITFASCLNVVLDFVFILGFHSGVGGAALATVLSQLLSCVLCGIYIKIKLQILSFQPGDLRLRRSYMGKLCRLGMPMGIQYSITAIGSVILQSAVNNLGTNAVAAVTVAGRISNFFVCPLDAVATAMVTYGGQNAGAGKWNRMENGIKASLLFTAGYSIFAAVLLTVTGRLLMGVFLNNPDMQIVTMGQKYLQMNYLFYFLLGMLEIFRFFIQGVGYSKTALASGGTEMVIRTVLGLWIIPAYGFYAACISNAAAWMCADAMLIPVTMIILRKKGAFHAGK